jgi:protein-S-isoprenylcysteine O-methyltransferase Ste14
MRTGTFSLIVRNLLFTVVVPGLGGVWVPWWLLTRDGHPVPAVEWAAVPVIAAGAALYVWCAWNFAVVGHGTPGPWDAPAQVVTTGPYRWVRNPIYLAALLVVLGQAWLFRSLPLLAYAGAMAIFCHLFVTGYEERALRRRFGSGYLEYRRTVPRWLPRPPRSHPWPRPGGAARRARLAAARGAYTAARPPAKAPAATSAIMSALTWSRWSSGSASQCTITASTYPR